MRMLRVWNRGFLSAFRYAHRSIEPTDVVWTFKEPEIQIIRMRHSHIPLVLPIFREYQLNETVKKSLGVVPNDDRDWPTLFNVSRYPYSYFAIDKTGEPVGFSLNAPRFKNPEMDPIPPAPVPETASDDPQIVFDRLASYCHKLVFEKVGVDQLIMAHGVFATEKVRGTNVGGIMLMVALRLEAETAMKDIPIKFPGIGAWVSSTSNRGNMKKTGAITLGEQPDHLYTRPDGTPFRPAYDDPNGLIVYIPFKEFLEHTKNHRIFQ